MDFSSFLLINLHPSTPPSKILVSETMWPSVITCAFLHIPKCSSGGGGGGGYGKGGGRLRKGLLHKPEPDIVW